MSSSVTLELGELTDMSILFRRMQQIGWTVIETRTMSFPVDGNSRYGEGSKEMYIAMKQYGARILRNGEEIHLSDEEVLALPNWWEGGRDVTFEIPVLAQVETDTGERFGLAEIGGQLKAVSPDRDFAKGIGQEVQAQVREIASWSQAEEGLNQRDEEVRQKFESDGWTVRQIGEDQQVSDEELWRELKIF